MVDAVAGSTEAAQRPRLEVQPNMIAVTLFVGLLAVGVLFSAYSLQSHIVTSGMPVKTWLPFLLLGVALLIALGFEFVNGFHDTANAVATVIYTHSMPANVAVIWSGFFQFLGRAAVLRRGCLRHHLAPPRRAHSAGWQRRRLRH